jgi:DNA helicase-2/ATP-dependent DNA helicase PcrA
MLYVDLHIHSKYSRATSRDCDLEHLYFWARRKGVGVVGTGDFTHPAWMAELREKLVPAEPGLFRLREDIERAVEERLPHAPGGTVRFMLSVEISNIYKRADKTRKVHNLIYVSDFESAERFTARLACIGNVAADGRPILGLDSRDLLELTLESSPAAYLVPAHVWTPWFSVLGSKSGFDAVQDCYADLAPHVFALETGLSSDPAMNWRVSALDRYRLMSSSDAHSPPKLGREATLLYTEPDYFAIRRALETGEGFGGTVEFFPEEGKYHLDGHRKCNVCLAPGQAAACGKMCPVCGKPLTLGVLHRVEELADQPEGRRPANAAPFDCLVALPEVIAETLGTTASSQKVRMAYERLLARLGAELFILKQAPIEDIERSGSVLLGEAIARMRSGKVLREGGYDGEYGVIRMFEPGEIDRRTLLPLAGLDQPAPRSAPEPELFERATLGDPRHRADARSATPGASREAAVQTVLDHNATAAARRVVPSAAEFPALEGLDTEQRAAASISAGALLIVAGPGTGKTRTLTHRLAHLLLDHGVPPEACLVLTFSRRAADEVSERLHALLGERAGRLDVFTFHAFGAAILREHGERIGLARELHIATEAERVALLASALDLEVPAAHSLLERIARVKRGAATAEPGSELEQAQAAYERHLRASGAVDFDDLVRLPVQLLDTAPELADVYARRYRHVCIDEYQDIDGLQYRLLRQIVPRTGNVCAIGDPDQAIYAFRGADVRFFLDFARDFPAARRVELARAPASSRHRWR